MAQGLASKAHTARIVSRLAIKTNTAKIQASTDLADPTQILAAPTASRAVSNTRMAPAAVRARTKGLLPNAKNVHRWAMSITMVPNPTNLAQANQAAMRIRPAPTASQ